MKINIITTAMLPVLLGIVLSACTPPQEDPIEALLVKAGQGDAVAQYELAEAYNKGQGVERDTSAAAEWYRKAAEQDHSDAQFALSRLFPWHLVGGVEPGPNPTVTQNERIQMIEDSPVSQEEAGEWLLKAARQGNARAAARAAFLQMRLVGIGIRSNEEAREFLRMAAEQGDAWAAAELGGRYYERTQVIPENLSRRRDREEALDRAKNYPQYYAEAAKYFLIAESNNRGAYPIFYRASNYYLARMYRDGTGVPQDYVEAYIRFSICRTAVCTDSVLAEVQGHLSPEELSYAQEEITRRIEEYERHRESQETTP